MNVLLVVGAVSGLALVAYLWYSVLFPAERGPKTIK